MQQDMQSPSAATTNAAALEARRGVVKRRRLDGVSPEEDSKPEEASSAALRPRSQHKTAKGMNGWIAAHRPFATCKGALPKSGCVINRSMRKRSKLESKRCAFRVAVPQPCE